MLAPKATDGFALSVRDYEVSLQNPAVKNVERRVRCEVDAAVETATTAESVPARASWKLTSGATYTTFVQAPKGSPSRPFTWADHVARFHQELLGRWSPARCDAIVEMSRRLASLKDIGPLIKLVT